MAIPTVKAPRYGENPHPTGGHGKSPGPRKPGSVAPSEVPPPEMPEESPPPEEHADKPDPGADAPDLPPEAGAGEAQEGHHLSTRTSSADVSSARSGAKPQPGRARPDPGRSQFQAQADPQLEHMPQKSGLQADVSHLRFVSAQQLSHGLEPGAHQQTLPEGAHQPHTRDGLPPQLREGMMKPQRPLPPVPREAYHALLREGVFQGPLRGSPLEQKLMQRLMMQQMIQQNIAKHTAGESGEPLTHPEIMQLFKLRDQVEKKELLRQVIRHEMAKARQAARERVQQAQSGQDTGGGEAGAKTGHTRAGKAHLGSLDVTIREQIAAKLKSATGDSVFESMLRRMLQGERTVPELAQQLRARFAAKSENEWRAFFANMLNMNSSATAEKAQLSQLLESLFRGLFTQAEDGQMMLVSDLLFAGKDGGEMAESRFARVPINNPELAQNLSTLSPGDIITQELMKMLGETFTFLQLNHLPEGLILPTEQQQKEALHQMRQLQSSSSRKKMEDQLFAVRKQAEDDDEKRRREDELPYPAGMPMPPRLRPERFFGRPQGFVYLMYALGSVLLMILIFLLVRAAA